MKKLIVNERRRIKRIHIEKIDEYLDGMKNIRN
jgi:hypothetical protein